MANWPTDDLTTSYLDNPATDRPDQARSEILLAIQKLQTLIAAAGTAANQALLLDASARINLPGGGIIFPATQVPSTDANTFDDYEEGTWTPSVGGTATYTAQIGTYTKMGRKVLIEGSLTINVIGTGSTYQISGLPFTPGGRGGVSVNYFSSLAASVVSVVGDISGTTIAFRHLTAAAASLTTGGVLGNTSDIRFSGHYYV